MLDKQGVDCSELDSGLKDAILDLLRSYFRILLLMQGICTCFILLSFPSLGLMLDSYRMSRKAVFFIPYAIFFVIVAIFLGLVRKRVGAVIEWIQRPTFDLYEELAK